MDGILNLFTTSFTACVGWLNAIFEKTSMNYLYIACIAMYCFYVFLVRPMIAGNTGNIISGISFNKGNNQSSSYTKNKIHKSKKVKGD